MKRRTAFVLSGVGIALACCFGAGYRFLHSARFGAIPSTPSAFAKCSHFHNGTFHNTLPTPVLTDNSTMVEAFTKSLVTPKIDPEPTAPLPTVKIDLKQLPQSNNILIWLGHSSFYIQLSGKRILIDPVLSDYASPISWSTKAFKGTHIYDPKDFPNIDFLIISHDHWDHLDYPTVIALKDKIGNIICPLGTDAHFLRWGFPAKQIHALDWNERFSSKDLIIHALEARHYSGRSLDQNKSFWAGYLIESDNYRIFFSGDSGYSPHFKEIGKRFGRIDLALLDSGQYNERWRFIHMNPDEALRAAKDLQAQNFIPAHIGKFCISMHPWYEPFERLSQKAEKEKIQLITPKMGEPLYLSRHLPRQLAWWKQNMNQQKQA